MAANKDTLGALHEAVATYLQLKIESGEATAGDISAAIKFLKDNGIEAITTKNNRLTELAESLPSFDDPETEEVTYQ